MKKAAPPKIPGLVFVQPLGSGGYADVFLYEQQSPRMPVAVKVLKADGLTDALRRQFVEEADTMAALGDHPYIVQVFRSGASDEGRPYLVMKYYPPPNLATRARAERFSVEEVLRTGIQLASAVETAHRANITHRDIKPANVLISAYGAPGLTDFGIAGRGGLSEGVEPETTDDVGVSVPWAAPEVLYGQSNGDERSDVYSLAATLWQLLVGRSPFEVPGGDNSAYALMPRIRSTPPPSTGRQDVPAGLERLLAQAMAKDPAHRPVSALEFARALQSVEQNQRLARTPIVVLDEQGHTTLVSQTQGSPTGRGGEADDDRTRIKAPQTVVAQPGGPSPTLLDDDTRRRADQAPGRYSPAPLSPLAPTGLAGTTGPAVPGGSGSHGAPYGLAGTAPNGIPGGAAPVRPATYTQPTTSRTSPLGSDLADGDTVRRPSNGFDAGGSGAATGQAPPQAPAAPTGPFSRPGVVWGLIAGVIVLVAVTVYLLARPSGIEPPDATPSPTVVLPSDTDAGPNGLEGIADPPSIEAESVAGGVTFRWSYASPAKGDTFRLYVGKSASEANKAKPLEIKPLGHTVKAAPGTQLCGFVIISRDGARSPASKPTCETAK